MQVVSFERAIILAALREYAPAHTELVAPVDQAVAGLLADWGGQDRKHDR